MVARGKALPEHGKGGKQENRITDPAGADDEKAPGIGNRGLPAATRQAGNNNLTNQAVQPLHHLNPGCHQH